MSYVDPQYAVKLSEETDNQASFLALSVLRMALARDDKERQRLRRESLERLVVLSLRALRQGDVLQRIHALLDEIGRGLRACCKLVMRVTAKTTSRLIVHSRSGLAYLLFEYGTALHPVFGVPYIPASSIKGALRSFLVSTGRYGDEYIDRILGSPREGASQIIVTDAYLTGFQDKVLEPEVTTPIYRESPEEHKARPVPIVYPVVAPNVSFTFFVGLKDGVDPMLRDDVIRWVGEVLREGIGAKTCLGYGELVGVFEEL